MIIRNKCTLWHNGYMKAMVYHMLTTVPFSETAVQQVGGAGGAAAVAIPLVVQLTGRLFDTVVLSNRELRAPFTRWVNWAAKRLRHLARTVRMARAPAALEEVERKAFNARGAKLTPVRPPLHSLWARRLSAEAMGGMTPAQMTATIGVSLAAALGMDDSE